MSDVAEGIGGAIEGALAGRAVEPARGEGGAIVPGTCLNCGAQTTDKFCSNCGQKTHVHRTISAILHDLMHGVLHLDGKLWLTLPLLAFRPGRLTRRYIDGERAKFVSPMAMFLFSVFAMFAIFQAVGLSAPTDFGEAAQVDPEMIDDAVGVLNQEAEEERARLQAQIDELAPDTPDQEREQLESNLRSLETVMTTAEQAGTFEFSADDLDFNLTGIDAIDQGLFKKWRENPGLMVYKLQANAYKFSWLLIPLSIPFVWLTFAWRRRFKAYDHAIFVTYSLGFMSLLFIALSVLGVIGVPTAIIVFSVLLIPPIHIYKQLRGAYELSRFSAFWRLLVLLLFVLIILTLFLQALFLLGAF